MMLYGLSHFTMATAPGHFTFFAYHSPNVMLTLFNANKL